MDNQRRERGSAAEGFAADYLRGLGFEIVETNFRFKGGEIDIVALEGEVLVFVEVRSRAAADHGDPIESVTWPKRRRLIRTARCYLATRGGDDGPVRFDVLGIIEGSPPTVTHLRDAFGENY